MAMLLGYYRRQSIMPETLAQAVGRSLRTSYGWDMLESVKNHYNFKSISLPSNVSFLFSPRQWYEWLKNYGPLWVTTVGAPSHAVVVHGISGDLTPEGTSIKVLNPWDMRTAFDNDPVDFNPPNKGLARTRSYHDFAFDFGRMNMENYGKWRILYLGVSGTDAVSHALSNAIAFGPAPGTNPGSSKSAALAEAQAFAALPATTAGAFSLTHTDVASRLISLIKDPNLIDQSRLNLCGPAAFFHVLLRRDPVMFVRYTISLFMHGRGTLGGITVSPDDDLIKQVFDPGWGIAATDWMTMSSLRDDQNGLYDYEGTPEETVSAATTPAEMRKWLKATGLYRATRDEGNWVLTKGSAHARGLSPGADTDVMLLINSHIMADTAATGKKSDEFILSAFPNHFVVLNSPISELSGNIQFQCWTWGSIYSVSVNSDTFDANYYGAVIAEK